jgi:hypothetical protein
VRASIRSQKKNALLNRSSSSIRREIRERDDTRAHTHRESVLFSFQREREREREREIDSYIYR